jgi:hypothetical protein
MPKFKRRPQPKEGIIQAWLMGLLAASFFAFPTAMLMWLLANKELALYGSSDAFINTNGFWAIIGFFAFIAIIFPHFLPSVLGKIWRLFIHYERF